MTIYRQNSYKLLTIHKNEFRKTKNISKNDQNGSKMTQNGSKMVVSIQIWIFAVGQGFFEQKVPTPLEFSLSFCYFYTLHLVFFADYESRQKDDSQLWFLWRWNSTVACIRGGGPPRATPGLGGGHRPKWDCHYPRHRREWECYPRTEENHTKKGMVGVAVYEEAPRGRGGMGTVLC